MGWWAVVQGILTVLSVAQGIKSYRQAKKLEKEANQLLIQKYGTGGGIPVIYGTRRVAGTVVFAETVNNRELFVVYALATGEVEDISDIRIGGRSITDRSVFDHYLVRKTNYYGQTTQEINNILANQDPPNKPRMVFNCHMGEDDQVADPMLVGCVPGWTSNHRLRGITYIACNFDYDSGGGMFNGLPEITCTVQGKKLYDPTKDSTVTNGSGSHRQNDTSTYEHSDNSALVLLDYLTNPIYGKGIPFSAIDIQSFITATNKHTTTTNISHSATVESIDANADTVRLVKNDSNKAVFNKLKVGNQVTITNGSTTYATGTIISKTTNTRFDDQEKDYRDSNPTYIVDYDNLLIIHLSDGAVSTGLDFTETPVTITMTETGKRFPFNGVIDTEKSIFENVKDINANMRGIFTYTNGQYALKIEDSESVTLSIDDDDILSSGITVNLESKDSIYNIVEVEFANAQKDYELDTVSYKHTSATPGEDYTYDDNGEELKLTIDMSFITSQAIAYQYAKAILLRSRNNKEIAFQGTPRLLNAKVGELISVTNTELGMNAEQYRITEMTINSDLTVQVNAIIYQSNIYGYVTPPGETIDIPDDPVDSFRVDTPTNLNFVDKDPSTGVQPYLTWNNSSNYPAYEFRVVIKDSSSNVLYDGRTKNTHFDLSGIQVANGYTAEVQAINTNRVESEVATYNFNNSVPPVQNSDLGDSSVTNSKVADISADKIDTGVLNLGTESGMAVRQGKTGYTDTTTGFWLGNDSGTPKFHIGTSSNFLKFDGSALNIAGSLTATNLTIDANATINGTLDASVIRLDGQDLSNLLAFGTVTGQTGNFFKINNQLDLEGRFYWDANNQTNYWDLGNGSEDQVSLYVKAEAPIVFQDGGSALGTFELNFGDDVNNANNNATDYISLIADWSNAKQSSGDVTKFIIKGRSDDLNSAPQQTIASFEFSSADGFGLAKTVFNGQIETPRAVIEDYITIEQDTAPSTTTDKLYNVGGSLYWNGAVVDTGGGDITSVNISTSLGSLTGGANFGSGDATFTLDIASTIRGAKTFDDDVVIEGDLTVQGATTSLEVATLNVEDKNITLNYGTGDTSGSANGSGITIQDAFSQGIDATILWDATNDTFDFNSGLQVNKTSANAKLLHLYNQNDNGYRNDLLIENTNDRDAGMTIKTSGGAYEMWLDSNGDDSLIFSPGENTSNVTMELYQDKSVDIGGNVLIKNADLNVQGNIESDTLTVQSSTNEGIDFLLTDNVGNAGFNGIYVDYNVSGTDTLTGDRSHRALFIDTDSSASGGNTDQEHRVYSIYTDTRTSASGDSDIVTGIHNTVYAQQSSGTTSVLRGTINSVQDNSTGTARTTNSYAMQNVLNIKSTGTDTGARYYYTNHNKALVSVDQTADINQVYGSYNEVEIDQASSSYSIDDVFGVMSRIDIDYTSNVDLDDAYLFYGNYQGDISTIQSPFGVYIATNVDNYFRGQLGLNNSSPSRLLHINADSTVNGTAYIYSNILHEGSGQHSLLAIRQDNASATGETFHVRNDGTGTIAEMQQGGNKRFKVANNGDISFYSETGSVAQFYWDASALRLGIGNSAPNNALDVTGNISLSGNIVVPTGKGLKSSGEFLNLESTRYLRYKKTGDSHNMLSIDGTNDTITFSTTGSSDVVINSSGNIDVAGTVISDGLTVAGNGSFSGTAPYIDLFESDTTNLNTRIANNVGDLRLQTVQDNGSGAVTRFLLDHATGDISFYEDTGTTAKFFWDASAETLSIGATSTVGNAKFYLKNGSSGQSYSNVSGMLIDVNGASNSYYGLRVGSSTGNSHLAVTNAGNVGINTSSPTNGNLQIGDSDADFNIAVAGARTKFGYDSSNNSTVVQGGITKGIIFCVNNSTFGSGEAGRFDASGHLLIGTTSTSPSLSNVAGIVLRNEGHIYASRDGGVVSYFNRKSTDGTILDFRKNGSNVGNIGTTNDDLLIYSTATGHKGLRFAGGEILPVSNAGALEDNTTDLGSTAYRFKNLQLSGTANVGGNLTVQGTLSAGTIAPDSVNTDTLNTESIIFDSGSTNIGNTGARHTTTSSTSQTSILNMSASFTSVKFQVQITDATNSDFHVTEIMVLNDGTNQYISEYGTITTGSALATFDADKTATNLRLLATPTTSNTLAYKIIYQAIYS